jgi:hypothetical protein
MSVVQIWKDGKRLEDAQLLKKRSLDREKEPVALASLPTPKTGLNYVELAYEKYMTEQKEKAKQGLFNLLEQELPS